MMTFVRSITFNWSQNSTESILTLVKSIDQMLPDNQMEHMFMGIVCGILDTESRIIKFTTRGHIYPLFLRNDDTCEWLGIPALPLGIGKEQESIELSTVLLPGERLLCFTDGLLATNNHNAEITFQQIEIWARESTDNDNSKWLKSIETKYLDWCSKNNATPIDDITLFTIINLR
jgi:serine phosphatase RsbU (regulator of sigma subunit)